MNYYIDDDRFSLDQLLQRIKETDLVPSRSSLLVNIDGLFSVLRTKGYATLGDLRKDLKNSRNIHSVSIKTGIGAEYLTLLRREIEGYFPKTIPVSAFNWLPAKCLTLLESQGYRNSALIFDALHSPQKRKDFSNKNGIEPHVIDELFSLVSLVRIQWVSPVAARILVCAGYENPKSVAAANAERMYDELDRANREGVFFKGTIGLRDVRRLIKAASYIL